MLYAKLRLDKIELTAACVTDCLGILESVGQDGPAGMGTGNWR
jgi:hypothetical protein